MTGPVLSRVLLAPVLIGTERLSDGTTLVAVVEVRGVIGRLRRMATPLRAAYLMNRRGGLVAHSSSEVLTLGRLDETPVADVFRQSIGTTPGIVTFRAKPGAALERMAVYSPVPGYPDIAAVLEADSSVVYSSISSLQGETFQRWSMLLLLVLLMAVLAFPAVRKRYPSAAWGGVAAALLVVVLSTWRLPTSAPHQVPL